MDQPKIAPERLRNPINYKIIIGIILGTVVTHLFINYSVRSEESEFYASVFSIINPLTAGTISIIVGFRYSMTRVFTRAYIALGIGFLCAGLGEMLYAVYDLIFDIPPFPSFADVFFLAYYPFILTHLVINIQFFKTKFSRRIKIWLIGFPLVYSILFFASYQHEESFETILSLAFIVPDSIALALTVVGTSLFRQGLIGTAWFILLLGMLTISSADIWYYHLESLDEYSLEHPVNILWYAGYWIIVYSLYKHRESI